MKFPNHTQADKNSFQNLRGKHTHDTFDTPNNMGKIRLRQNADKPRQCYSSVFELFRRLYGFF